MRERAGSGNFQNYTMSITNAVYETNHETKGNFENVWCNGGFHFLKNY